MKQTIPEQSQLPMKVINKPKIAYTKKSIQFFASDWRKVISALVVLLLPILNNAWRAVPEGVEDPYYGTTQVFAWTVCIHLMILLLGIAWYFLVPEKDNVLRFIALAVVVYGLLLTLQTFHFTKETPFWLDLSASIIVVVFLHSCFRYIQNHYLEKPNDYKVLHDGLVHDIHHKRFMGSINRIAGLLEVAEMEEPYKCLCREEIEDIRESIAYIAEKYEALK